MDPAAADNTSADRHTHSLPAAVADCSNLYPPVVVAVARPENTCLSAREGGVSPVVSMRSARSGSGMCCLVTRGNRRLAYLP